MLYEVITLFRQAATEAGANVYDPAEAASTLQAPVLVLRRVDFASAIDGGERALADLLPNATYVEMPGDGLFPWSSEPRATLGAIRDFLGDTAVAAEAPAPVEPGRFGGLQTILFTDITGSTTMQRRLGDAPYQEALRAHDLV